MIEPRFEDKHPLLSVEQENAVRCWLRSAHGGWFRPAYPDRIVNTLYFDNPRLTAYTDNVEGATVRYKARLRWYGALHEPVMMRFEIKSRANGRGTKQVAEIAAAEVPLAPLATLAHRLRAHLPPALRTVADANPWPVLISSYRREYLTTRDGVRLTIDTRLRASSLLGRRRLPRRLARPSPLAAIVEVKYDSADLAAARAALLGFPVALGKHSKYAWAVEACL